MASSRVSLVGPSLLTVVLCAAPVGAQQYPPPPAPDVAAEVRRELEAMKAAERGPYERLRWFCADGTVQPPQGSPCRERGGGVQHAEPNARALRLAELDFHVGTILQATPYEAFADSARAGYRLQELVLERYLFQVDDGWVMRRARYYRGALQIEDEERAGRALLERRFSDGDWLAHNYLLASRLAASLPHRAPGAEQLTDRIRAAATEIAALDPEFQRLRVRIHSAPSSADIEAVQAFVARRPPSEELRPKLAALLDDLRAQYDPERALASLASFERRVDADLAGRLAQLRRTLSAGDGTRVFGHVVELAPLVRERAQRAESGAEALDLVDLGLALQERAFALADDLAEDAPIRTRAEALTRLRDYVDLAYAAGFLSARERAALRSEVDASLAGGPTTVGSYRRTLSYLARALDWGRGSVRSTFGPALDRYALVEPASTTFPDAVLRGSVMLPLSHVLDALHADLDAAVGAAHTVFGRTVGGGVRGLNPGFALAPLDVLEPGAHHDFDGSRIYVLPETPPEMKPVAGVLTLAEGNLLSHVQLLARNLGIPNAVLAPELGDRLAQARGREVFYAVTPMGRVIVAWPDELGPAERGLLARRDAEPAERLRIDTSRLRLDVRSPVTLDRLRASDSGVLVGPKAANLGQLAADFPGRVSPAFALPFGMFVQHVDRPYGDSGRTVLEELRAAYGTAAAMRGRGATEDEVDAYVLERLAWVRSAIEGLEWIPSQREAVVDALRGMLEGDVSRGVFVRSDTNVEDLPQFSGAGLNLTVAHQVTEESVLASVKRVWTSPFTERAYLWRKQILEEQGDVFPSVLVQQTVPSAKSGVLITSGLQEGDADDLTVVTAEGVGGAVEGEDAETLLLRPDGGVRLLSQTKAPRRREVVTGGTRWVAAGRPDVLLADGEIDQLRSVVSALRARDAGTPDADTVWDIEFGFLEGRLWLFQIRPFVRFRSSEAYARLEALDASALAVQGDPLDLHAPMEAR